MVKEQYHESDLSRRVSGVQFLAGSAQLMKDVSHMQLLSQQLYVDGNPLTPTPYGAIDQRLGTSNRTVTCTTCGKNAADCVGHFGMLDLELPVYHSGFFRQIIQCLQCLCKRCNSLLLTEDQRERQLAILRHPKGCGYLARKAMHARIVGWCKKQTKCRLCGFKNGVVKKAVGSIFKIVHVDPLSGEAIEFAQAVEDNKDLRTMILKNKQNLLTPLHVKRIFDSVKPEDMCLLICNDNPLHSISDFLLTRLPVPPVCIRPSVVSDVRIGTTEDDLTMKLGEIQFINDTIRAEAGNGVSQLSRLMPQWEYLQILNALYINSEIAGLPQELQKKKPCRSFTQRMKGKQGRFRGNLSGKRVDFSGRTVISPDPNLRIDQVGVPILVAKILTFPEIVTPANLEHMRRLVVNGADNHPGAVHLEMKNGEKIFLRYGKRERLAERLAPGDKVLRHMIDGDVVLFNRQPSLHKVSIMAHRAKIMPHRTFRFNECVCTPYNADFDGDEMNLHFPQTQEARAEASELMAVRNNLITPRSGEPLVAAIQDFITGGYLLTQKDRFLNRAELFRLMATLIDGPGRLYVPPPAIIAPQELWTGKQVIELIIRIHPDHDINLNLSVPNKSYGGKNEEFDVGDSYVLIRNSVLLAGCLDKSLLGSGSKTNIFYILMRDFGAQFAADAMWRVARVTPVFLMNHGFSIGIGDVRPGEQLKKDKETLVRDGNANCDRLIKQLREGNLKCQPGCTAEQTLESQILKELSSIRDKAGQACLRHLSKHNAPLTMAVCGSKGSFINISQMIACVGQQAISGSRPPDGFESRSLPHFERNEKTPAAKGFVSNSFYSGLTPTEFFFHTMAGREGLVDTAVKTAETGYMQRRLVKCLEDLCAHYDGTVRSSVHDIVQFTFGDDGLDPALMEAKDGQVLDLKHVLRHIRAVHSQARVEASVYPPPNEINALIEKSADGQLTTVDGVSEAFKERVKTFLHDYVDKLPRYHNLDAVCHEHVDGKPKRANTKTKVCARCTKCAELRDTLISANCLSTEQLRAMIELCRNRYMRALTEPGTAVGAIAATSIGEPSTQMTLKTFHFAGVASMNITQGVPRIREIINAVKKISTPLITAKLQPEIAFDAEAARRVKARIEATRLGEICEYIEDVYLPDDYFLLIKLSAKRVSLLQLEVTLQSIIDRLCTAKLAWPLKPSQIRTVGHTMLCIRPQSLQSHKMTPYHALQYLKYNLPAVVIKGYPTVARCVVNADERSGKEFELLVEGGKLDEVLATHGVLAKKTKCNNALEMASVLGIEAARTAIIEEILATMAGHGIQLDRRHVMLLADVMTYRGEVLAVTRNGLCKMKESVLMLASFEKTMEHLFDAAFYGQKDDVCGVSECIIMGMPMNVGTGLFKVLHGHREHGKGGKGQTVGSEVEGKAKRVTWMDDEAFDHLT